MMLRSKKPIAGGCGLWPRRLEAWAEMVRRLPGVALPTSWSEFSDTTKRDSSKSQYAINQNPTYLLLLCNISRTAESKDVILSSDP